MKLKLSRSLVCLVALIAGVGTACGSDQSDVSVGAGEPAEAPTKDLPNRDAYYDAAPTSAAVPRVVTSAGGSRAIVASVDARRGVPTFLWASKRSTLAPALAERAPEAMARWHLGQYAHVYKLAPEALDSVQVGKVHDTGRGGIIVTLKQQVDGVEIFRGDVKVLMARDLELIALSGSPRGSSEAGAKKGGKNLKLAAPQALALAFHDLYGLSAAASNFVSEREAVGPYGYYDLASTPEIKSADLRLVAPSRVKKVFFPMPDRLVLAYYLEILAGTTDQITPDAYAYVIAADDGRVLYRQNLTEFDAFNYKVFADADGRPLDGPLADFTPHPTGVPDSSYPAFAAPVSIAMEGFNHNPQSLPDPWLSAAATQTLGNNVDAYADLGAPDGFSAGDLRAVTTAAKTFDYTFDPNLDPRASPQQSMAAVTDLFYVNNWLHDWWYDAGFNEAAGNAQLDNFGRGGLGGDVMHAEAQDFSGTNNANMSTPADGSSPRMQMFLWSGLNTKSLTVTPPGATIASNTASFGPTQADVTAAAVLADDGVAPNTNGCEPLISAVAGKIAVIDRGVCTFTVKVKNAQNAGAVGVLILNNAAGAPAPAIGGADATITIPVLSTTFEEGNNIKTALQTGPVSLHMAFATGAQRDGTIDNSVVAHEWGHYLHHRLVNCGGSVCGGMSEGWGDFTALQMVVRPGDNLDGVYPLAVYAAVSFSGAPAYFGIRRYPYSTDMTKNGLTFKHMTNGEALPPGPIGAGGPQNAEVHNTGEVWSSMLFEGFISLLKQSQGPSPRYSFEEARRRMSDYIVAGMTLTPVNPTYLEQRDALLAAAYAADPLDADLLAAGFAKRGAGSCAVSPTSDSLDNTGVVESFGIKPNFSVLGISLNDSIRSCDTDGVLDAEETGRLTIEIMNTGGAPLVDAAATVSTTTAGVSFPSGTQVTFGSIAPGAVGTATLQVALDASFTQIANLDVNVTLTSADTCAPMVASTTVTRVNVDDAPGASATDTVESESLAWTRSSSSSDALWVREVSEVDPTNHVWHGVDLAALSDTSIESPDLHVSAAGNFGLSFTHRHQFEFSDNAAFDGSVIEISEDGGASWVDISTYGDPGYTGVIFSQSGNPLGDRQGYTDRNASWPSTDTVTIDLGTALAGKTVKIRFRVGTDTSVNGFGWQLDDIAFQGITNTPFHVVVTDATECPIANGGACAVSARCSSGFCVDGVCCDTACGGGNAGDCQACSTAAGAAVNGTCSPLSAATVCRAAAGACDVAESCNGVSTACPADAVKSSGKMCRAAAGVCDVAETCNGVSTACPTDVVKSSGTSCRAAAGACDVAESCNGVSTACPADVLKSGGTVCRAAANTCDLAEACSGAAVSCPPNGVKPDLSICHGPLGLPGVCLAGLCL